MPSPSKSKELNTTNHNKELGVSRKESGEQNNAVNENKVLTTTTDESKKLNMTTNKSQELSTCGKESGEQNTAANESKKLTAFTVESKELNMTTNEIEELTATTNESQDVAQEESGEQNTIANEGKELNIPTNVNKSLNTTKNEKEHLNSSTNQSDIASEKKICDIATYATEINSGREVEAKENVRNLRKRKSIIPYGVSSCSTSTHKEFSESSLSMFPRKAKKPRKRKAVGPGVWSHAEKQKFVTGLNKKYPFRKEDGNIDWQVLKGFVGSGKSLSQVKEFAKKFHELEHGNMYPEFSSKAAVDIWRQLAEAATNKDDNVANICVPQVMTVAALEPVNEEKNSESNSQVSINYNNVYNYLSAVTRGTDVPDIPPDDALVVLELLEDLIKLLSKSETLIQREFMHNRYAELRQLVFASDEAVASSSSHTDNKELASSSTNPYSIPFEVLDFKTEQTE